MPLTSGFGSGWRDSNPRPLRPEQGQVPRLTWVCRESNWSGRWSALLFVGAGSGPTNDRLPEFSRRAVVHRQTLASLHDRLPTCDVASRPRVGDMDVMVGAVPRWVETSW